MHQTLLLTHSAIRWVVLLLGFWLALSSARGWMKRLAWSPTQARLLWAFGQSLLLQILVGLALYFGYSPITKFGMNHLKYAAHDPFVRYWTLLHGPTMIIALGAVQVGKLLARKNPKNQQKIITLAAGFALLLILAATPWPGLFYGRPWLRF